eukprot:TRINITY_DN7970_c0_g1_i4.p1 TRINITY_DN7970_c0_g1~~TRINITY_DN7970_c0_g1_i4.p1  ORF type:complete len:727 (-),score=258.21 TRINITY_DN7970_c0_g1_i4:122-2302(-)
MADLKTAAARTSAAAEGAVREAQLAEMVFKRAKADEERLRRSSDLAKEREEKKRRKKKAADDAEAAFGTFMDSMAAVVPAPDASYGGAAAPLLVHGAEDGEEGDGSVISGSHVASTVHPNQQLAHGQTAQRVSKRGPPPGIAATPWPGRYLTGVLAKDSNKIRNLLHNEVAEILFMLNPGRWNDETLYGKPCQVAGVRPRSLAHRDLLLRALFRDCPGVKPDDPIDPAERWSPHLLLTKLTGRPIEARQPPIGGGTGSRDPPMSVAQESALCVREDGAAAGTTVAVKAVHNGLRLKMPLPVVCTLYDLKMEVIESFGWTVTPGRVQVGYLDNGEEYTLVSDRTVQSFLAALAADPRSADAITLVPTMCGGETHKKEKKRRLKEENLPSSSKAADFAPPVAAAGDTQAAKKRQRTTKKEEPKEERQPAVVKEESPQTRPRKKKGRAAKKEEQPEQQQGADKGLRAPPVSTDADPGVQASPKKTLTKKKKKLHHKSAATMDGEDIAPDCSASSESALGKRAQREELDRREKLTTEERNAEAAQAARVEGAIQRRSAKKSMAAPPKSLVQNQAAESPSMQLQAMRAQIEAEVRARLQQEFREEAEAAKKQQAEAEAVEAKEKKAEEHEKKKEAVTGDEKEAEAAKKQQAEAEAAEAKKKKTEENEKKKEAVTGDEEEAEDDNNDEADAWWEGGEEERDDAVRSEPEEGDDAAVVKKRPAAAATDEELGR